MMGKKIFEQAELLVPVGSSFGIYDSSGKIASISKSDNVIVFDEADASPIETALIIGRNIECFFLR